MVLILVVICCDFLCTSRIQAKDMKQFKPKDCELRATIYGRDGIDLIVVVWDPVRVNAILGWIEKEKIETPKQTGERGQATILWRKGSGNNS